MDLNDALAIAKLGHLVRDDASMKPEWAVAWRAGRFVYLNPKGEEAHNTRFSDAMKASFQWRLIEKEKD